MSDADGAVAGGPMASPFMGDLGGLAAWRRVARGDRIAHAALMEVVGAAFGIGPGRAPVRYGAWAPRFLQGGRSKVRVWRGGGGESFVGAFASPVVADWSGGLDLRQGFAGVLQDGVFRAGLVAAGVSGAMPRGVGRSESETGAAPVRPAWAWNSSPPARAYAPGLAAAGQGRFAPAWREDVAGSAAGRSVSADEARMVFCDRLPMAALPLAGPWAPAVETSGTIALGGRAVDDDAPGAPRAAGLMPAPGMQGRPEDLFEDYFARQARLPPAGGGAFDPRLTPVWFGQKLAL